jgi:HEAT repeat protein
VSQRRDDVAVDKLIDIAQHDADLEVRKQAMYWLGQTQNPKALKFLRDLITR